MLRAIVILIVMVGLISAPVHAQDIPKPLLTLNFTRESAVAISLDVSHLALWESSGQLTLYDLKNIYTPFLTISMSDLHIRNMHWSTDYANLLLIERHSLYVMDTASGKRRKVGRDLDQEQFIAARFFQEDRYIVAEIGRDVGSFIADPETYVWDATTLQQVLHIPPVEDCPSLPSTDPFTVQVTKFMRSGGFLNCPYHIEWNPDQSRYMTWAFWNSSTATTIKIYDAATLELTTELSHYSNYSTSDSPQFAELGEVNWSPDGSKIVSVPLYGRDKINVWDARTGELQVSLTPLAGKDPEGLGASDFDPVFSADGKQIITSGTNGYLFLWDVASGALIHQWHFNDYSARGAKWVYDNQLIVGWGLVEIFSDKGAMLWDASTGELRALLIANGDPEAVYENKQFNLMLLVSRTSIDFYDLASIAAH